MTVQDGHGMQGTNVLAEKKLASFSNSAVLDLNVLYQFFQLLRRMNSTAPPRLALGTELRLVWRRVRQLVD